MISDDKKASFLRTTDVAEVAKTMLPRSRGLKVVGLLSFAEASRKRRGTSRAFSRRRGSVAEASRSVAERRGVKLIIHLGSWSTEINQMAKITIEGKEHTCSEIVRDEIIWLDSCVETARALAKQIEDEQDDFREAFNNHQNKINKLVEQLKDL